MAKITLNGVDALTESGGVVTIPGAANLVLGTNSVPSAAIQADAITSAHLDTNIAVAGTLGVTGATTLSSTLAVTGTTTLTGDTTITGDLTVNGTTTTINSTTLTVDDKNIELAHSPSGSEGNDTAVDGGGITLKISDSDKTILYEKDTKSWDFNQKIITRSGEAYMKSLHRSWVMGG